MIAGSIKPKARKVGWMDWFLESTCASPQRQHAQGRFSRRPFASQPSSAQPSLHSRREPPALPFAGPSAATSCSTRRPRRCRSSRRASTRRRRPSSSAQRPASPRATPQARRRRRVLPIARPSASAGRGWCHCCPWIRWVPLATFVRWLQPITAGCGAQAQLFGELSQTTESGALRGLFYGQASATSLHLIAHWIASAASSTGRRADGHRMVMLIRLLSI